MYGILCTSSFDLGSSSVSAAKETVTGGARTTEVGGPAWKFRPGSSSMYSRDFFVQADELDGCATAIGSVKGVVCGSLFPHTAHSISSISNSSQMVVPTVPYALYTVLLCTYCILYPAFLQSHIQTASLFASPLAECSVSDSLLFFISI